jgi:hypothetical protein
VSRDRETPLLGRSGRLAFWGERQFYQCGNAVSRGRSDLLSMLK